MTQHLAPCWKLEVSISSSKNTTRIILESISPLERRHLFYLMPLLNGDRSYVPNRYFVSQGCPVCSCIVRSSYGAFLKTLDRHKENGKRRASHFIWEPEEFVGRKNLLCPRYRALEKFSSFQKKVDQIAVKDPVIIVKVMGNIHSNDDLFEKVPC